MTLNTAMLAPTPAASVISVISVKTGARQSRRRICLSSVVKEFTDGPPDGGAMHAGDIHLVMATHLLAVRFLGTVCFFNPFVTSGCVFADELLIYEDFR